MAHSPRGGIDAKTLEIRAAELTTSDVEDVEPASTAGFGRTGEGCCLSFSTRSHTISKSPASLPTAPSTPATCHDAIAARGAAAIIPPRKNAKPWKPDIPGAVARNEALRASKRVGQTIRRRW
jgi:hypothetical protein